MKLLHVDDHNLFCEGLGALVTQRLDGAEYQHMNNATCALAALDAGTEYDIIIIDLCLPDIGGVAFLQALSARQCLSALVVLSASHDIWQIKRCYDLGAAAFVAKESPIEHVLFVLDRVYQGETYIAPEQAKELSHLPEQQPTCALAQLQVELGLNPRQRKIMELMYQGLSNEQIAAVLHRSINTVKSHVRLIFKALDIKSRIDLVHLVNARK